MDTKNMIRAVGLGMAAGAAVSMMAAPRKKHKMVTKKSNISKAIRAMGDVLEDVEHALGW